MDNIRIYSSVSLSKTNLLAVLLPGNPPVSVCIPHKVGSHAWGEFARKLAALYPERTRRLGAATWRQRASWVRRAVVVRHPLDRLVSAYRMIFQVRPS